ncbi:MAG TPA: hypothetical protein VK752_05175 [Bryobacteraceae bacterium]|jgi:hypothetical protein|nr:hypothetical protein [Bryobacteraceae bacterium]
MSYEKKSLRLLGGSLSLLTPGDKVAAEDGIQMQNWRADQSGSLRSRGGSNVVAQLTASARVHSIAQRGSLFYFGADTSLFRATAPGTAIATGFDGNKIGMVPMAGYMWCLNRGANGKDDGTTFSEWQIAAPTQAPTLNGFVPSTFSPSGTYTFYYTYYDNNGNESAPSPPSAPITTPDTGGDFINMNVTYSTDPTVVGINLYAIGGTLGSIYQVATQPGAFPTGEADPFPLSFDESDADATTEGIIMQLDFDPPPAASGLVGPYFSRLLAFSSAEHPNRMWWTKPDQPGYWPGSLDDDNNTAQWVDVGDDGEEIVWVTVHPRSAVIYKERTVWILFGDPDTGTLQQAHATVGLRGQRAVANAGDSDYFLGTSGQLLKFDLTSIADVGQNVRPLFQGLFILQGVDTDETTCAPIYPYGNSTAALGFGNGQLMVSYQEQNAFFPNGGNSVTMLLNTVTDKWFSHRVTPSSFYLGTEATGTNNGFNEFYYAGPDMWGCIGNVILGLQQGDFTMDFSGSTVITHVYQSPFLDCNEPDNTKVLLEVVIDAQMNIVGGSDELTVFMHYDNGQRAGETLSSSLTMVGRGKFQIAMPEDPDLPGRRCTNFSLKISCDAENELFLHSVYVYYYVEPRAALVVSTIPAYLGGGKLVQTKELQIEIDTSGGPVTASWSSDLPGNALAVNERYAIPVSAGQRNFQLPFLSVVEGRLFQLLLQAAAGPFRLYGAKVLARVIGVLVEAYEAAAGFVWDSQEHTFESGLTHIPRSLGISLYANPIKQARELELQIDTIGPVTVVLMSDLPGNQVLPRFTAVINTNNVGWRTVKVLLPTVFSATGAIEGRIWRLQLSGTSQFKLYNLGLEILPVGVYVEAYEAAAGAIWDSRAMDLGTPNVKEAREIEVDIDTTGAIVQLLSDLPTLAMSRQFLQSITTTGRQKIMLPLPLFPEGRLWELTISGANSFKLYGARLKVRAFGAYVTADEAAGGALWDSTQLDLGSPKAKQFRELEFELWTYGPVTITLYLDLFGNQATVTATLTVSTSAQGRRKVLMPLAQPSYGYGRLMRATISSANAFKVFGARVNYREVGTLVEAYEAQGGAVWGSTPIDLGVTRDKVIDQVRLEMDTDAGVTVQIYTDLPGESMTLRWTQTVSTVGFGRRWITLEMPGAPAADTQGRLVQVVVSSMAGFRLFQGDVSFRVIGRYLAAGVPDAYRALDQDFGTERIKLFKRLEIDIQSDGPLLVTLSTNQLGTMGAAYAASINTSGLRRTLELMLPANTRGRLVNIQIGGASSGRLYGARVWTRPVNEPSAQWEWHAFPVEDSESLPQTVKLPIEPTAAEFKWAELPVPPTAPEWEWAPFPVAPTDAQWNWVKFLGIDPTSEEWKLLDLPVEQSSQ